MRLIATILLLLSTFPCISKGVYQSPTDFIAETFQQTPPPVQMLWLTPDNLKQLTQILEHPSQQLRIRYWQKDNKTVWILNEIGKEKPITAGIVIENNRIQQLKILIFRESRGWEIKNTFFTDQFNDITLDTSQQLTKTIDGITGATLSVNAVKKMSRVALYLQQQLP